MTKLQDNTDTTSSNSSNGTPAIGSLGLVLRLRSPAACRQRAVKRIVSLGKGNPHVPSEPPEPDELRLWHIIIEYRNDLINSIRECSVLGPQWAKEAAKGAKTRGEAQRTADAVRQAVKQVHDACLAAIKDLDEMIDARPRTAKPPAAVIKLLRDGWLARAVRAVEKYLSAKTHAERADAWNDWIMWSLASVAPLPLSRAQVDQLVAEARDWQRSSGRSGSRKVLARFVVAKLVGLSPDARELR